MIIANELLIPNKYLLNSDPLLQTERNTSRSNTFNTLHLFSSQIWRMKPYQTSRVSFSVDYECVATGASMGSNKNPLFS